MRIILSDFISLDGVVQSPGGKEEDADGEFQHGGWSMPFFDSEAMGALRASGGDGGLQVWGSASLARQLVENDLVDEYCLMLEPILLGGGKTIFPSEGRARQLELVSVTQAKTGVIICAYRPAGRAAVA